MSSNIHPILTIYPSWSATLMHNHSPISIHNYLPTLVHDYSSSTQLDQDHALKVNNVYVKYHLHCHHSPETLSFEEYRCKPKSPPVHPHDDESWKSFWTWVDFEFAEIALDSALNNKQINALIKLFHHCITNRDQDSERFTLSESRDLQNT